MADARAELLRRMVTEGVLGYRPVRPGRAAPRIVNVADTDNTGSKRVSVLLGEAICRRYELEGLHDEGADAGSSFEGLIRDYLEGCLGALGEAGERWTVSAGGRSPSTPSTAT